MTFVESSGDIDPKVHSTFVCDLTDSEVELPSEQYHCFRLPNKLQHLRELEASLRNALRVVKPSGVLFASEAGLLPLIPDGPDYWRPAPPGG